MNWRLATFKLATLLVAGFLVALCLVKPRPISFAQSGLDERAIAIIAERNGVPAERLAVDNSAPAQFALQQFTAFEFKIVDIETGTPYGIALDKEGNEVSIEDLSLRERDLYLSRYGKVDIDLAQRVDQVSPDELLPVDILLHRAGEVTLQRPAPSPVLSQEQVTGLYNKLDQQRTSLAAAATRPFVARLADLGIRTSTNEFVPIVSAQIRAGSIVDIARFDEVERISLEREVTPLLDVARPTIRADQVQAGRYGNFGQGIQVAQVEVEGRVEVNNPYLSVQQDPNGVCPWVSDHSTAVAGVIASWNTPMFGVSPGVTLRAYGDCRHTPLGSNPLMDRSTDAQRWGARVLNLSWGIGIYGTNPISGYIGLNAYSLYYDDAVINGWRTIVASAGNDAQSFTPVTPPADGYNVITVGNFDDAYTTTWADDVMSQTSTRLDPASLHADRQKPEVAAPGENITTTSIQSPWNDYTQSGTSFSAAMVTGTAALMMRANGSLSVWPEALKAILMATAAHNIEGDDRLSDADGAGGIDAKRATDVARNLAGKWGAQGYTCGAPNSLDIDTLFIPGNTTVRVAVVWDQNTSWMEYAGRPSADLDIQIIDPQRRVVASSSSWDNTYEIVRFTTLTSGIYTLRVNKFRCSQDPKWIGWAWHLV
jgi:serine protease AprX